MILHREKQYFLPFHEQFTPLICVPNMTNNTFIIYDKAYENCANILLHLFSNYQDIKASIYTQKEAPKFVSREKVLYIGEECTSDLNSFKGFYDETGIHIGIMGTKAWIRCEEYNWGKDSFFGFESKLSSYCSSCQMDPKYTEYKTKSRGVILLDFLIESEPWEGNFFERIFDKDLIRVETVKSIIPETVKSFCKPICEVPPEIRKWQYLLGTLMFYKDYLDKYIGIDQKHETNQELTPDEKKK